jgi:LuxR family maltose regulon positive regulatory protein
MLHTLLRPGQTERVEAALAALDEHERGDPEIRATLASLRLGQHDLQAAAALAPVIDGSVGSQPFSVAALLLEAAARDALRDPAAAGRALERALDLAGPNNVLMAFLIHPAPELLERHSRQRTARAVPDRGVLSLLAATSRLAAPPGEPQRLREPISQAETHVLQYLPTNSPRQRSPASSTCRRTLSQTHMRHLYQKLGARRRSEAVEQARALGLLASSTRRP